jgi:hypothetical protein
MQTKMKKFTALLIMSLPLMCIAQSDKPRDYTQGEDTTPRRLAVTYTPWGTDICILKTPSDEVYVKLMREFRREVRSVYLKPNKWGQTGEYTNYTIYFPKQVKPKLELFVKNLLNESRSSDN